MGSIFLTKSPFHAIIIATVAFMLLNAVFPLNFSLQAEATKYPFKLIITLEKTTYKLGEPFNVFWTLVNIGEENVTLYHSVDHPLDFIVYDENFNHVYRYRCDYGIPMVYYPFFPISPGNNWTERGSWDQIYDGSGHVMPELWHKEVPPGTYYVSAIFSSGTYNFTLYTPAIRITIIGT